MIEKKMQRERIKVAKIVNNCKKKYGSNFRYFLCGSFARGEKNPKDIDILVYPVFNKLHREEWESLLKMMKVKVEKKRIDAQIVPELYLMLNDDEKWKKHKFDKYVFYDKTLNHRVATMFNSKSKRKRLEHVPFIYEEM